MTTGRINQVAIFLRELQHGCRWVDRSSHLL